MVPSSARDTLPDVSVILPTFNRVVYVREAIESVIAQTYRGWELIVADDGSGDETRAFLSQLTHERIMVVYLPHFGNPSVARNAAIRKARGRYLAFLDSDDVWLPPKLEKQLAFMRARPDRRWSYGRPTLIDELGDPLSDDWSRKWIPHEGAILEALLSMHVAIAVPTVVTERSLVEDAGGFDEELAYREDYDLWIRLAMLSDVSVLPEPLVRVRLSRSSHTRNRPAAEAGWIRLYEKHARSMTDSRLRSLCVRQHAEMALVTARAYRDEGQRVAAVRTVVAASRVSSWRPLWWLRAARAVLGARVPVPASIGER
ncbi:MAG TPA: glycosyltransferase [Polyangiaceae bacterium]|nr:glycosyltransferase [Polyangiaceae bacterium]